VPPARRAAGTTGERSEQTKRCDEVASH